MRLHHSRDAYTLVNLRTAYQLKNARLDLGVANLFNKFYSLPLGDADIADWKAGGSVGLPGAVECRV